MSYYDHEIKVKIIDSVLAHEQNWEWFIQYTEETFDVTLRGDTLKVTLNSWRDVYEVFYYLTKIHEVTNTPLSISKEWLKELNKLALFYNGAIDLCNFSLNSNFSIVMRLLIYAGKIYNQTKGKNLFYYSDIFTLRNLSSFENLDLFVAEEEKILQLLDAAPEILKSEKQVFLDNINGTIVPADIAFVDRHMQEIYSANCFSFNTITDDNIRVWEELELLNMLAVSIDDGKLVPKIDWGTSVYPNFTIWTKDRLTHIKNYFNSPITTFITETIGYVLHGDNPSVGTISKHFELLYELSENTEENYNTTMDCSSLEIIRILFSKKCTNNIIKDSYKKYAIVLNKLYANDCKYLLRELLDSRAITEKSIIKKLHEEIKLICNKVEEISDYQGFTEYIKNKYIQGSITNNHFEILSSRFDAIAPTLKDIRVAHLFLLYFEFLIQIKNNKDIISNKISHEILRIRTLWQKQYFVESCKEMQIVKTDPIPIPKDYLHQLLAFILYSPDAYATQCMKLQDSSLITAMQSLSDAPMTMLVSKILISNDFPSHTICRLDDKHPIDILYSQNIDRIRKNYAYKFRNNFSAEEFTENIFETIKREMEISLYLIEDIQPIYNAVSEQNSEYVFLEYSENLHLGHLTQLFPILENKIRKFGELFGIVPIRENIAECHRLKEPDTVLKLIINYVMDMGGTLQDVSDMYFVHFCMFGENGMNIRNRCIHGLDYCHGDQLKTAFKATLLSLYMIGWRMQVVLDNMSNNNEAPNDDE